MYAKTHMQNMKVIVYFWGSNWGEEVKFSEILGEAYFSGTHISRWRVASYCFSDMCMYP